MSKKPKKIWWCEPRWHYVPKQIRGFRTVLPMKRLRLCFIVFGLITIGIALAMKIWIPNLQFDWLKAFATSIAAFIGMMLLHLVVHIVVPPIVSIDRHGVRYSHGQTGTIYKHEKISRVHLLFFSGGRIRMRIRYANGQSSCLGVSPKVDLNAIEQWFGDKLRVRDCRDRGV